MTARKQHISKYTKIATRYEAPKVNNHTSTEEEPGLQRPECDLSPHLYHSVKSAAAFLHKQTTKIKNAISKHPTSLSNSNQ